MNEISNLIDDSVPKAPSAMGYRHRVLLDARRSGHLTQEQLERICFNELEDMRIDGKLKEDRPVPDPPPGDKKARARWHRATNANASDEKWLKELHKFACDKGLELSEEEKDCHYYITTGNVQGAVEGYLTFVNETMPAPRSVDTEEIPF